MCGIAGIIRPGQAPAEADIRAMTAGISYRGPDSQGHQCLPEDGVALGHRRLSILDLSAAGAQPMASADGRYWLVYNGEIYNYLEIRRELMALGREFRSDSDSEVLLQAFAEWGPACLERCMGMYAFALWDRQQKALFAARDRLGIKPFYYRETGDGLQFASEPKSILALGAAPGVDTALIDAYMDFGYVPGEETMHRGIRRLLPGHSLHWQGGKTTIRRYWDVSFDQQSGSDLATHARQLREMLTDSVALHLRSDVPVGVFLSGGLDSSAVVALLAPGASAGLKTFSVAWDFGPDYDETPYAREVAAAFATDHHEIRVDPGTFRDFVPDYIRHMDEPVTEAAAISLYHVSRLAREQVVVCLSGEGSDELFAGYDLYTYNLAMERVRGLTGGWPFQALAGLVPARGRLGKLHKYLRMAGEPLEQRYRGISSYEPGLKRQLYTAAYAAESRSEALAGFLDGLFSRSAGWDPLSRMLYFDLKTWLVDDLLIKADRMSMATSIELRVPFLDHRLVEFAATIPAAHKISGRNTKRVLKEAVKDLLPERIIKRPKLGFPTPLELMFRGELYDYARDLLLSRQAVERGYFERAAVDELLSNHHRGVQANHREIWQLVVLEEWHRRYGY